jgi:hypothetical protein
MNKCKAKNSVMSFLIVFGVCGLLFAGFAWADVDNRIYAELLQRYVKDGIVDYRGFKSDEANLDRYLEILAQVDPQALPKDERFAFYVNAYNAWTIKLILSRYPNLQSIKDLGSFLRSPWKKELARIDGKILTLDNIEHDILRPQFKDPRVHFAVNCASKGCPPLLGEPYAGARLNQQLEGVTKAFINNPQRNRLDNNLLYVSKIFKWFADDFNNDIVGFFKRYADEPMKTELERRATIKLKYLEYDWSLNGR